MAPRSHSGTNRTPRTSPARWHARRADAPRHIGDHAAVSTTTTSVTGPVVQNGWSSSPGAKSPACIDTTVLHSALDDQVRTTPPDVDARPGGGGSDAPLQAQHLIVRYSP